MHLAGLTSSQVLRLNTLKILIQNNVKFIIIKGLKTPTAQIQLVGYLQVQLRMSIGAGDKLVLRGAA